MPESRIRPNQSSQPVPLYRDTNLLVIFSVTLTLLTAITAVSPAFPKIAAAFNIPASQIGLLISVYVLPTLVLDPIIGIVADRTSRKRIIVLSLIVFGVSCAACAFAHDFRELLLYRFLQGIGAAGLRSLPLAIVGDLYFGVQRIAAMGYIASVTGLGAMIFATLGGGLGDRGWQYPFGLGLLSLPIALLVGWALKNPEPKGAVPFKPHLVAAFHCLKNYQRIALYISSALLGGLNFGIYQLYFPLLMENTWHFSSSMIGIVLAVSALAFTVAAASVGRLAARLSEIAILQLGFSLCALALLVIPVAPHFGVLLFAAIVFSIGNGMAFPSVRSILIVLAPKHYLATTMSMNGTSFGIGQVIAPLLMGGIVSMGGIGSTFYISSGTAIAAVLLLEHAIRSKQTV